MENCGVNFTPVHPVCHINSSYLIDIIYTVYVSSMMHHLNSFFSKTLEPLRLNQYTRMWFGCFDIMFPRLSSNGNLSWKCWTHLHVLTCGQVSLWWNLYICFIPYKGILCLTNCWVDVKLYFHVTKLRKIVNFRHPLILERNIRRICHRYESTIAVQNPIAIN